MIDITITGVDDIIRSLDSKTHANLQRLTLNKVGNSVAAKVKDEITQTYAIRKKDLHITTRNASSSHLVYTISAPARQRNIAAFKVKQIKKPGGGLTATVKYGQQEFIRGAFIAIINGNKLGLKRAGKDRLPIISIYRLSIGHLLKSEWLQHTMSTTFDTLYTRYLYQSLQYLINKSRG